MRVGCKGKGSVFLGKEQQAQRKDCMGQPEVGDSTAAWHVWRTLDMWNNHECVFVHSQGESKYAQKSPSFL